jgi:hypothetical protein
LNSSINNIKLSSSSTSSTVNLLSIRHVQNSYHSVYKHSCKSVYKTLASVYKHSCSSVYKTLATVCTNTLATVCTNTLATVCTKLLQQRVQNSCNSVYKTLATVSTNTPPTNASSSYAISHLRSFRHTQFLKNHKKEEKADLITFCKGTNFFLCDCTHSETELGEIECWAETQRAGRSCCGRSETCVLEFRFKNTHTLLQINIHTYKHTCIHKYIHIQAYFCTFELMYIQF